MQHSLTSFDESRSSRWMKGEVIMFVATILPAIRLDIDLACDRWYVTAYVVSPGRLADSLPTFRNTIWRCGGFHCKRCRAMTALQQDSDEYYGEELDWNGLPTAILKTERRSRSAAAGKAEHADAESNRECFPTHMETWREGQSSRMLTDSIYHYRCSCASAHLVSHAGSAEQSLLPLLMMVGKTAAIVCASATICRRLLAVKCCCTGGVGTPSDTASVLVANRHKQGDDYPKIGI